MNRNEIKISVCMATHNGARFLREQLDSILVQLEADDELVISDDSSTDATLEILMGYADPRIRLSTGNTFFSPIFNFEHALTMATGTVIVLADQDDVWLDNKLDVIRTWFASRQGRVALVALDGYVVDDAGKIVSESIFQRLDAGPGFLKNIFNNRYLGCCLAFSRDLLTYALPFPRRIPMHDMWLGQLCELLGETAFVAEKTICYRKHGGSLTDFRIRFRPWLQIKRRWFLGYYLLARRIRYGRINTAWSEEQGTRNGKAGTPLISMVMPCYQQVDFLEEAVCSVLDQEGVDVELLVMDPGSTDGSRELLRQLKERYGERLVLHLEPDQGQSDAINRGMNLSRGRILGYLNSDDRLHPGALAMVASVLDVSAPAWTYGQAGMIDARGNSNSSLIVRYKNWRGRKFSPCKLLTENFIPQMAVFWNRPLWERSGSLDLDKHLDMDYDLWLRFAAIVPPTVIIAELADFRVHSRAKGSLQAGAQLRAAYATARQHAVNYGFRGKLALLVHLLFSFRTWLAYRIMKP
jgi:glycosyltransferase involved in cell wall biosynthesis